MKSEIIKKKTLKNTNSRSVVACRRQQLSTVHTRGKNRSQLLHNPKRQISTSVSHLTHHCSPTSAPNPSAAPSSLSLRPSYSRESGVCHLGWASTLNSGVVVVGDLWLSNLNSYRQKPIWVSWHVFLHVPVRFNSSDPS